MENSKKAIWRSEANGYDLNGTIISQTPQYDSSGNFLTEISPTSYGSENTTQPILTSHADAGQNHSNMAQKQQALFGANSIAKWDPVAEGYINPNTTDYYSKEKQYDANGNFLQAVTMENTAGSGEDKNSALTQAGSLASLNNNTENTQYSALNTPATQSPVAGNVPTGNWEEDWNREYAAAVARNDLQAQINLLTQKSGVTGEDYSDTIKSLNDARNQKIMAQDGQNWKDYYEAVRSGDLEKANQLAQDIANYRNMVGYDNAIKQVYEQKQQEIKIEYDAMFLDDIRSMADMLNQLMGEYINFQYDPTTDTNLARAQAYAEARMQARAERVGLRYSTMWESAVASAVAELIPVYEQMAKDEIKENIAMLQSTANFLVGLEETAFNMWSSQIKLKIDLNAEKRKQAEAAWDRVNLLGYVDNEASTILGVPAGTLSPEERKHQQEILEEIDKEDRALKNSEALAKIKSDYNIREMQEQNKLNKEYYEFQQRTAQRYSTSGSGGKSGTGGNISFEWADPETGITYKGSVPASEVNIPINGGGSNGNGERVYTDPDGNEYIIKDANELIASLSNPDGTLSKDKVQDYLTNWLPTVEGDDRSNYLDAIFRAYVLDNINKNATNYGEDRDKTRNAFKDSFNKVQDFANWVDASKLKNKDQILVMTEGTDGDGNIVEIPGYIYDGFNALLNTINDAKTFDNVWGDLPFQGDAAKQLADSKVNARDDIYNMMTKSNNTHIRGVVADRYASVLQKASQKKKQTSAKKDAEAAAEHYKELGLTNGASSGETGDYLTTLKERGLVK